MGLPGLSLIFKIISFLVASWILIHLMAVLGVFLVVAYPIWWLLFPRQTVCFFCRIKEEGEMCPFCKRKINKQNGIFPETLASAIYNGLLIMIFSIFSLAFVYGEGKLLYKLGFPPTPKTVSFVIPQRGQYRLGEIFPMKIDIAGIKTPINAVQADISFDPTMLEVKDVSVKDSFADIFLQKQISNELGFTRLTGGLPNPGYSSPEGVFGTIYFQTKLPGVVKVDFLPSSLVLANDGRGTNVLKELASVSYLILPDEISQEEREQQEVILQPGVLGESYEKATKMTFFEDTKVLGLEGLEKGPAVKTNLTVETGLGEKILIILGKIDQLIISFWQSIFGK